MSAYVAGVVFCDCCPTFVVVPLKHHDRFEDPCQPACPMPGWELITKSLSRCPACKAAGRRALHERPRPRALFHSQLMYPSEGGGNGETG